MDSPHPTMNTLKNHHIYKNVHPNYQETKLCIIIDSKTPIIMKVPIAPESLTLGRFKAVASLQHQFYKFYFKSHDDEFGVVKEEIIDDDSYLPVDGDRIVAWVITNATNQSTLFEPGSSREKLNNTSKPESTNLTNGMGRSSPNLRLNQSTYVENHQPKHSIFLNVQLKLDNYNFLGLTLVGPSDDISSTDRGIYVGEIAKKSVVEQDGRIEVGDRIIEINGLDVRDMKNDDAVAAFRSCVDRRGAINLVLERNFILNSLDKGRFTLPREYVNGMNNHTIQKLESRQIPIPIFDHDQRPRPIPPRPDNKIVRGTHSLPRSITPRSLYATNNFENLTTNNDLRLRIDSRSVYEPTTPTSIRQFNVALHCAKDDIRSIYTALRNDAKSLDIKDREWLKVVIKNAFLGSVLVKWLSRNVYGFSHRREIKRYANQMLNLGLIRNPMASGTFSEKCYYTFS